MLCHAQVFRGNVGPDGKVTFSDKPPVETNAKAQRPERIWRRPQNTQSRCNIGENCGPCQSARIAFYSRRSGFGEKIRHD
jgi:hypothetical protein